MRNKHESSIERQSLQPVATTNNEENIDSKRYGSINSNNNNNDDYSDEGENFNAEINVDEVSLHNA